jgi:hypothetical protein
VFNLNARVAFRHAHGWSQQEAAEHWNELWPNEMKIAKNFSYWELWPGETGHAPSVEVIERLARLYQCSAADLLADRGNYRHLDPVRRESAANPGAAAALEMSPREAPHGWYVKSLITLLCLDTGTPWALEERTVVATRDGLSEIATSMSVPRHPADDSTEHGLHTEVLSGGRLELRDHPHESQFRHVIALARPLAAGDQHEYKLSLRIPPGQMMIGHSVQIPLQRSDFYRLTVRFPPDRQPPALWIMDGVPPAVIRDQNPNGMNIIPDSFGEVTVEFNDLVQGQAYGLRWIP